MPLFQNFELLVESKSGIDQLRELILSLAIKGKLNKRVSSNSNLTFSLDSLRLEQDRLWGDQFIEASPLNWARLPLAKLGSWGSGGTPLRGNREYYGGNIPWLIIGDLNDGLIKSASNSITQKGLQESSATKVPVGAVFIAMYGSIGKSGIAGIECATNQAIAHCVPHGEIITSKYLFYLIRALRPKLLEKGRGLAQQNISQTVLKHLMVAIPPLDEQEIIVSKIEELMQYCDHLELEISLRNQVSAAARKSAVNAISGAHTLEELRIAWERIKSNWEVLVCTPDAVQEVRTLILDLAVRGLITAYDTSDRSAEDLISESIKFANKNRKQASGTQENPFEIPEHWVWSTIEELCETQTGTTPKILDSDNLQEPIHYVTAADMVKLKAIENRTVPLSAAKRGGRIAPKGSVLFVGIGATIGKCCLLTSQATFNQQIHAATPRNINAEYLCLIFASGYFQKICQERTNATAIPILNKSKWETIQIPVPPLKEQRKIADTVSALFYLCDELESFLTVNSSKAESFSRTAVASSS